MFVVVVEFAVAFVGLDRFFAGFFALFVRYRRLLGHGRIVPGMKLARAAIETPLGLTLLVESDGQAVCSARFTRVKPDRGTPADSVLREAKRQTAAYFRKRLRRFDLPLRLHGTPFQTDVWRFVACLETGELVSYGDLARLLGRPRAHRGVAAAMRLTPIDFFIPAHRVVGADGTVRGAGPNSVRRRLLAFEGIILK